MPGIVSQDQEARPVNRLHQFSICVSRCQAVCPISGDGMQLGSTDTARCDALVLTVLHGCLNLPLSDPLIILPPADKAKVQI